MKKLLSITIICLGLGLLVFSSTGGNRMLSEDNFLGNRPAKNDTLPHGAHHNKSENHLAKRHHEKDENKTEHDRKLAEDKHFKAVNESAPEHHKVKDASKPEKNFAKKEGKRLNISEIAANRTRKLVQEKIDLNETKPEAPRKFKKAVHAKKNASNDTLPKARKEHYNANQEDTNTEDILPNGEEIINNGEHHLHNGEDNGEEHIHRHKKHDKKDLAELIRELEEEIKREEKKAEKKGGKKAKRAYWKKGADKNHRNGEEDGSDNLWWLDTENIEESFRG